MSTGFYDLLRAASARRIVRSIVIPMIAVGLASQSVALPASAQPQGGHSKADAQASARKLGEDGLNLFGEKKYAEAYEVFRSADELYHANTLVLFMGHCRREMGRLLEAREIYQKVVDEPVPKGALEQFKKAQATARDELNKLQIRIPTVKITLTGIGVSSAMMKVDGLPVSVDEFSSGKAIDPGEHAVRVEAAGAAPVDKTIDVPEGRDTKVTIELTPMAAAPVVVKTKGSILPGVVAAGVGVLGVGVGAVTGIIAKTKIDDIKTRCLPSGHCLQSDQANADTAEKLTTVSTISFIAGGAVLAAGVVLIVVRPGGGTEPEKPASADLHIRLGLGSIGVGGSF